MPRYPYRRLGTQLNRDFRNALNNNFTDVEADIKELYDGVDDVSSRIDNIVADAGSSNTEIVDARHDSINDVTYSTLKGRLDDQSEKINTLDKRSGKIVSIDEFGATGDGTTDDTLALQNAIDALQGTDYVLQLSSGKVYKISDTLRVTGNLSIVGSKQNRPKIITGSQDFNAIDVQGTFVKSTTLASSATVNTKYIDVADATDITVGSLIQIISSASWYHDPRPDSNDARKAEVHRVDEVVGNRIYLTDPLFDGYNITTETVTVNVYNPVRFSMFDIDVALTKYPQPTETVRKVGIFVSYTIDTIIENVNVFDAQSAGIIIKESYRPIIEGGRSEGANNYFSGYGVQILGCTHARVSNRFCTNCRRGIDVSGSQIPSHLTVVEGCRVFASGTNSLGDRYVYNDDHSTGAYAGGVGTHGPADHTIFRNNILGFLTAGVTDRGRNTVIERNYFVGDFQRACIDVSFAENLTVIDNYTYDGFTGLKDHGIYDGGSNFNTRKPPIFIRIQDSSLINGGGEGFFRIEGNFAMVQDTFLEFYGEQGGPSIPALRNFLIKNNHCVFSPQLSASEAYFIKNSTVTTANILMSGSIIKENTWKRLNGSGAIRQYSGVDPRTGTETESPKTYSFYLANDTVTSIFLGNSNVSYARVMVDSSNAYGLLTVRQGTTSTYPIGNISNVTTVTTVPTGTTGNAGNINLALIDGILYVENRLGGSQRIVITVFAII